MQPPWVGTGVSALQLPVGFIMSGGEEVKAKRNRNNGVQEVVHLTASPGEPCPPPPQTLLLIQAAHKIKVRSSNAIMPPLWLREQRLVLLWCRADVI